MKREVADFVARCLICQQVKVEHQKPPGKLQSLDIPEWKWDKITMDLVTGLPRSTKGYDSIWVIVDRLTKSAHFLPVRTTYTKHFLPISIVSDRGTQFTSKFWESFQRALVLRFILKLMANLREPSRL